MTVAADLPLRPSFRHIFTSNEIVSREAMFTRNDTKAVREQKRLFRLLGTAISLCSPSESSAAYPRNGNRSLVAAGLDDRTPVCNHNPWLCDHCLPVQLG
jgi:hypothetical protein